MLRSILLSTMAGVLGTALGGYFGLLFQDSKFLNRIMMYFSAIFMIGMSIFELIPEALKRTTMTAVIFSVLLGVVVIALLDFVMFTSRKNKPKLLGLTILFAIAIHNFPEGLAIGGGEVGGIGLELAILTMIHNVPEGMAITLKEKTKNNKEKIRLVIITSLSGMPTALGGLVGYVLSNNVTKMIPFCLAFAGGCMCFVAVRMIITKDKE